MTKKLFVLPIFAHLLLLGIPARALEDCRLQDSFRCKSKTCDGTRRIYCANGPIGGVRDDAVPVNLTLTIFNQKTGLTREIKWVGNTLYHPGLAGLPLPTFAEYHGNLTENKKIRALLAKMGVDVVDKDQIHLSGFDLPESFQMLTSPKGNHVFLDTKPAGKKGKSSGDADPGAAK